MSFNANSLCIQDNHSKQIIHRSYSNSSLFPINGFTNKRKSLPVIFHSRLHYATWHCHLGHPAHKTQISIFKHLKLPYYAQACRHCDVTKVHRQNLGSSDSFTKSPLQLIHMDVWGPASSSTFSCSHFYLIVIDDFSRYAWIFLLKNKFDVYSIFSTFKTKIENCLSTKIKYIRTDGGGEFVNNRFKELCSSAGIEHQFTCAYTPSQNGVAERKHRHIIETAVTMMQTASMEAKFWGEVVLIAVYLINWMPTEVLKGDSPFYKLYDMQPDYNFLKTLGCTCLLTVATLLCEWQNSSSL